jgi:hypothetical protein
MIRMLTQVTTTAALTLALVGFGPSPALAKPPAAPIASTAAAPISETSRQAGAAALATILTSTRDALWTAAKVK